MLSTGAGDGANVSYGARSKTPFELMFVSVSELMFAIRYLDSQGRSSINYSSTNHPKFCESTNHPKLCLIQLGWWFISRKNALMATPMRILTRRRKARALSCRRQNGLQHGPERVVHISNRKDFLEAFKRTLASLSDIPEHTPNIPRTYPNIPEHTRT